MRTISKELFIPFSGRPVATGFVSYISKTEPVLMHCHGWVDYSDAYDEYGVQISRDNGRTWTEWKTKFKSAITPEGKIRYVEPAAYYNPDTGKLHVFMYRMLYPDDKLDVHACPWLITFTYDPATDIWSEEKKIDLTPGRSLGISFCFPVRTSKNNLLIPAGRNVLDRHGKYVHYKNNRHTVDEVVTVIGRFDKNGALNCQLGGIIYLEPGKSSRGLVECAYAELTDGRIAAVCRGDNSMFPEKPGYKWVSFSEDDGLSWSKPAPMPVNEGQPIESGSNGSAFFRSIKTGNLYWVGNLCPEGQRANGNNPRTALMIAEIQEKPFGIKRDTITVIDEKGPNDAPTLQLSNFRFYQDRANGDLVLFLTRFGEKRPDDFRQAGYYRYRVEI